MRRVKGRANPNVALLKYWGRRDDELRIPTNNSLSLTVSSMYTETVISKGEKDKAIIDGKEVTGKERDRVFDFIDLATKGIKREPLEVVSDNSFPAKTGFSSSASGFAALSICLNEYFDLGLSLKDLSILTRKGSGSSCRSLHGGLVRWRAGEEDKDSYAEQVYPSSYWDLRIIGVVVSDSVKETPTSDGHSLAQTSPYFSSRLGVIEEREREMVSSYENKDFLRLADAVEREMFEFHAIPMTSNPPLLYWYPSTLQVIHKVREMRGEGMDVFSTVNTGHNLFLFTTPESLDEVAKEIGKMDSVEDVIVSKIGEGARVIEG